MSLGLFPLGDPAIAQVETKESGKKAPPRRTATALSDDNAVPETR